eukprot:s2438_g6.t1
MRFLGLHWMPIAAMQGLPSGLSRDRNVEPLDLKVERHCISSFLSQGTWSLANADAVCLTPQDEPLDACRRMSRLERSLHNCRLHDAEDSDRCVKMGRGDVT